MGLLLIGLLWLIILWWLWRTKATHWRDVLAGGLLFLLTVGFFWRTLSGDVYQPADGGDLVSFLYPTYRFAAHHLSQGVLPLWNPHLDGGAPWISDIQAGFLYLPNLVLFLVNPNFAYPVLQGLAIAHLYWAGLGLYVLLRTLRWGEGQPVVRPAALFGALAFQFSDPLLIHLGNLNLIAVLSWLPWVLAAYQRSLAGRSLRWAGVAALLFALGTYAGHTQSTLYVGLALVVYTMLWTLMEGRDGRTALRWATSKVLRPNLQLLAVVLLLTGLLTAPILLPTWELARYTERSEFTYQDTVDFSLAPAQAIGLLTPGFFGHGPALHWSLWQRVETPFAGVATLILAVAGVLLSDPATRRRAWPWLGLALFGFVTALGIYAIFHGWLTVLIPSFGQFRAPARALILWTLGTAVVAAVGFDRLFATMNELPSATRNSQLAPLNAFLKAGAFLLAVIFTPLLYIALLLTQQDPTAFLRASVAALAITLAAGVWLATWALLWARQVDWLPPGVFAGLLIGLLYFDLSAAGAYTDISSSDPTRGYQHPELVEFLKNDPEPFRIDTRTEIADLWQPDAAALYGLEDVGGVTNPLALRHWREIWAATGGQQSRLYDLLNVKYVIGRDDVQLPAAKFTLAFDAPGELAVYRNEDFLPRAWLVHRALTPPAGADTLATLQDPTFDPATTVLLATSPAALDPLAPATGPERVTSEQTGPNGLTLQVQATAPAYLVLSEVWYPGWQATVNGERAAVQRANHAFRAIYVPAGESTVQVWFAPRLWLVGLGGLGIGLVLFVILVGLPSFAGLRLRGNKVVL
jgi:hypothetical protein